MRSIPVFVIHVSTAEARKRWMNHQLELLPYPVAFMEEWDKDQIDNDEAGNWFSGELLPVGPGTSCARKHFQAYQNLLAGSDALALVLEDDIELFPSFPSELQAILEEINVRKLRGFILNLEESMLAYVPRSSRRPNQRLYEAEKGRLAGAYLIDREAAGFCLEEARARRCSLPIDWFHNHCQTIGGLKHYWSHPCLAIQGSLNGRIPSLIDHKSASLFRRLSFQLQRFWKRLLAFLH